MIDVKRNDIVSRLKKDYDFVTDQDCNETEFYYGFTIALNKVYKNYVLNIILNNLGELKIGFSKANKDFIDKFDVIEEDLEANISFIKKYDYSEVITDKEVNKFLSKIDKKVFDSTRKKSIFYKINKL